MLPILTIVVRKMTYASICNLKWMANIDVQQDCISKKGLDLVIGEGFL